MGFGVFFYFFFQSTKTTVFKFSCVWSLMSELLRFAKFSHAYYSTPHPFSTWMSSLIRLFIYLLSIHVEFNVGAFKIITMLIMHLALTVKLQRSRGLVPQSVKGTFTRSWEGGVSAWYPTPDHDQKTLEKWHDVYINSVYKHRKDWFFFVYKNNDRWRVLRFYFTIDTGHLTGG